MEGAGRMLRTWPVLALAAASVVVSVVSVAAFRSAAPYVAFPDLLRMAAPGLALGLAAAVVAVSGHRRSGPLMLVVASVGATAPALSIGLEQRWAGWVAVGALGCLVAPAVVWCSLTFPDGRLPGRLGHVVAWLTLALGGIAAVAVVVSYDPAAWSWCRCVGNPLAYGGDPGVYGRVAGGVTVARSAVVVLGLIGFGLNRLRPLPRGRGLIFAFVLLVLLTSWLAADLAWWIPYVSEAALILMPVLYVAGHDGRRPSRAHVADLLLAARDEHNLARLRALVARALGDPHTVVAWWDAESQEYRDHTGQAVPERDRDVLAVDAAGRPIAQVISDRLVWVGAGVRDSVAEALRLAAENRRLTTELRSSLDQVRDSRARILTASDETRRRIERDLHDGAQQLLISTGIKLNIAISEAAATGGSRDLIAALDDASDQLNQARAELRSIAGGIAPTALIHGSLTGALQEVALRAPVPTTVRVTGAGRPTELAASTIYFVVAECLTNIAKHADAKTATVEVELDDPVRLSVTDDGRGGAVLDGRGTGLRGLVDRIDAQGGALGVTSGAGGTTITLTLPLQPGDRSPA
jgi:signal transduction histidine kinase